MHWTDDREMLMMKEISDKLAVREENKRYSSLLLSENENSYFTKRSNRLNQPEHILREYDFSTPIELKEKLEEFWTYLGKADMAEYDAVLTVAAFKNKRNEEVKKTISPFVYEF